MSLTLPWLPAQTKMALVLLLAAGDGVRDASWYVGRRAEEGGGTWAQTQKVRPYDAINT